MVDRDAVREWFARETARLFDTMIEVKSGFPHPTIHLLDSKGKGISIMVELAEGMSFSEFIHRFVQQHFDEMVKKTNGNPFTGAFYFFHTQHVTDGKGVDRSTLHLVCFSAKVDGILDHVHASVRVGLDGDGDDTVHVDVLPRSQVFYFMESSRPSFDNPFFARARPAGSIPLPPGIEIVAQNGADPRP
jgi:hypothetical protein